MNSFSKNKVKKSAIKKSISNLILHIFLICLSIAMIYPLVWVFFGSFKSNNEIFGTLKLLPSSFNLEGFILGWKGDKQIGFDQHLINTFLLVIPTVIFNMFSSSLVAYGFARFKFPFHKTLFALMLSTLMLPDTALIIPRYMIFRDLKWLDTYLTFSMPALLATIPFYTFMIYQFFRGLPRDLDESAMIDGLGPFGIFFRILLPLIKPAVVTAGLLLFIWTWNDFFNALIYITSAVKYPISLGLRMMLDSEGLNFWNQIMAMSVVALTPPTIIFLSCQKYFVEGISTAGLKG